MVDTPMTYHQLDSLVSEHIPSPNLTYAIQITGHFSTVRTRTVARQVKPYPSLAEAAQGQAEATFTDIEGTLAGYLSPSYEQGITVAATICTSSTGITPSAVTASTSPSRPVPSRSKPSRHCTSAFHGPEHS